MTTYNAAAHIIADTLPACRGVPLMQAADRILRALLDKRISTVTMRASAEMFRRFHAHCRYLGTATEYGYQYYYDKAVEVMVETGDWPVKIVPKSSNVRSSPPSLITIG